ncbi:MAG: hypothetical protein WC373_04805 [Smithella sp.]|jgi:hypothetical protein
MKILLVEPQYRRITKARGALEPPELSEESSKKKDSRNENTLWYPPLGLMKLARFHKDRGDEVKFMNGGERTVAMQPDLFKGKELWDRVYITTLFTFHWKNIVETISYYKESVGGTVSKIYVGGIMASLMANDIFEETGVYPITGVLNSPKQIGLPGDENIDLLPPDYDIIDSTRYAVNDTYYGYTSRGCVNRCGWCGVPRIEPKYIPYIDIKPMIRAMREKYGDKSRLKLMDNNVLASPDLEKIVGDLLELGYGKDNFMNTKPKKQRVVDFNQGIDASLVKDRSMRLIAQLNIKPMRIAFDRAAEETQYVRAVELAYKYGVREFSNYMLYNWKDTPRDLYERLAVNICLNEKWNKKTADEKGEIYSYPMRFAPIDSIDGNKTNRQRDLFLSWQDRARNWLSEPVWTPRFVRNIEIMKGAAHGAISPTSTLAWRTIGDTFEKFLTNLYMPEELLRNRNKHEQLVYKYEPKRPEGTGKVEQFRAFILKLLKKDDERFGQFHNAVSKNTTEQIRSVLKECKDEEMTKWLQLYLKK